METRDEAAPLIVSEDEEEVILVDPEPDSLDGLDFDRYYDIKYHEG